jgi:hypothetical protein
MTTSTRRLLHAVALLGCVVSTLASIWVLQAPAAAFPSTPYPQISLDHRLMTTPFSGSGVSMRDDEGSAYVPRDNSLWLADDDGRKLYEVDPDTGVLKRTIGEAVLTASTQYGGGPTAGTWRDRDLESIAYDATHDVLYVFSGKCCTTSVLPTVFRLTRDATGAFQVDSYQPLAAGSDFTGAAWNPGDGNLYVGVGTDLRTYDYATNTAGPTFQVPKLKHVTGLTFSADGQDLYVSHATTMVSRVDWATRTLVSGWSFDLTSFGIQDARAVEIIHDQLWVSDGYDFRPTGDPLAHAVFVFNVTLPPPDYNIVGNSGFEQGTSGWNNNGTANVVLEQAAGGHSGSYAARLTNGNSTSTTMTLNDSPNWVATSTTGTYTAHAWVRSDTGTGKAYVRLREYQGSTLVTLTSSVVTLSPTWQQVTVSLTPQAAGSSSIDLNVYVSGAPAGTNLYVDDVVLNIG